MTRLLTTTALIAALSVPAAMAQTTTTTPAPADSSMTERPTVAVPEGFTMREGALTAEDLLGATVYDSTGESVGDVQDLVLSAHSGASDAMPGAASTPGMGATGTDGAATTAPMGTGTDTTAADTTPPATGTDAMGNTPPATGTDSTATGTMPPATGTDSTATGTMPSAGTGTGSTASDTTTTTPPATGMGADTATAGSASESDGETVLTHAVLDIGGFLGMGVHRVAIPVEDLQVYSNDSEIRVYLPWSREQLEALQAYDEDDPSTLGDPMYGASN